MRWLLDLLYFAAAIITAPIWMWRMVRTGKIRTDWAGRFGRVSIDLPVKTRPRLLVHAVSVGEVNAIRQLVERLGGGDGGGDIEVVISTTTDTGFARAKALWGGRCPVVRYPLDWSFAVGRFLNGIQPDAVALMELEVWPNFSDACSRSGIPVCVINGRLTERSFRRYRLVRALMRPAFARLTAAAVQNEAYAGRFTAMGVPRERVSVTGTMKWDTAAVSDSVEGADQLAREMGVDRARPLIVAGSTAPGEHELLHAATPPGVQLLCAPRKPEWFDQAAAALPGCRRRTHQVSGVRSQVSGENSSLTPDTCNLTPCLRFLLDTIGELRQAYALAELVVIGRSFGNLHGSDMMEPAALGKAIIVGPAVSDFQDTVDALREGDGIVQTTAADLPRVVAELQADSSRRAQLGDNARRVVKQQQGATERNEAIVREILARRSAPSA